MEIKKSKLKDNCKKLLIESDGFNHLIKLLNKWIDIHEELSKKLLSKDYFDFLDEYPSLVYTQNFYFINCLYLDDDDKSFIYGKINYKEFPLIYKDLTEIKYSEPEYYKKILNLNSDINDCIVYLNELYSLLKSCIEINDLDLLKENFPKLFA